MAINRICAILDLTTQSGEDKDKEEMGIGNISAEMESVGLSLGNTLRYLKKNTIYFDHLIWRVKKTGDCKFSRFWKYRNYIYIYIFDL